MPAELTPADTLPILLALRERLADPANWGAGSILDEPGCILHHATVLATASQPDRNSSYYNVFTERGELHPVTLALTRALGSSANGWAAVETVYLHNDGLHGRGDHPALLAWLDRAIATARADLDNPTGPVSLTLSGDFFAPSIEVTR